VPRSLKAIYINYSSKWLKLEAGTVFYCLFTRKIFSTMSLQTLKKLFSKEKHANFDYLFLQSLMLFFNFFFFWQWYGSLNKNYQKNWNCQVLHYLETIHFCPLGVVLISNQLQECSWFATIPNGVSSNIHSFK